MLVLAAEAIFVAAVSAQEEKRPAQQIPGTPVMRLVTLAPSLTELVYAAGAGSKLVAVAAYSDYPPAAQRLPVVANASGVSLEAIVALHPDLVLAWKSGTRAADIAALEALGIKVFSLQVTSLEDIAKAIRDIGRFTGDSEQAEQAARKYDGWYAALRANHANKPRLTVFFQISANPLMSVNGTHFISKAIALCGGENAFADSAALVFEPSRELLFAHEPQVILLPQGNRSITRADKDRYAGLNAYKGGHIYGVTADHVLRPGPRLFNAVEEICAVLDRVRLSSVNN